MCVSVSSKCVRTIRRWFVLQQNTPTQMCCHEIPWSRSEESPVEVWFAVAEELGWAAPSITQHCAAFCGPETMGRCWRRETGNLNLTQEALKATQNKLLSSGISPHWKTISTIIKGELNRLISSKVTEQPLLSSPPSPPPFLFPRSYHHSILKCHQISGGLGVIGQNVLLSVLRGRLKGKAVCFV